MDKMTIHVDYGQLPEQSSPKNGKIANVDNAGLKPSKWSSTAVSRRRGLVLARLEQLLLLLDSSTSLTSCKNFLVSYIWRVGVASESERLSNRKSREFWPWSGGRFSTDQIFIWCPSSLRLRFSLYLDIFRPLIMGICLFFSRNPLELNMPYKNAAPNLKNLLSLPWPCEYSERKSPFLLFATCWQDTIAWLDLLTLNQIDYCTVTFIWLVAFCKLTIWIQTKMFL